MSTRDRHDPQKRRPEEGELSFGLGLGSIFKGLSDLLQIASDVTEQGQSALHRTGTFQGPGKTKGVYGFSIQVGGNGPVIEQFGNIHTTEQGPEITEVREPLIDIFDETDQILIVAEMPGVSEVEIKVEIQDDILALHATGKDRQYAKEVLLPAMVVPSSLSQHFQNGILELRLKKTPPGSDT